MGREVIMRKFRIDDGQIEITAEHVFHEVLRSLWGDVDRVGDVDEEGVDSFHKFDYQLAAWIEDAGVGWIEVPDFVANEKFIVLDV